MSKEVATKAVAALATMKPDKLCFYTMLIAAVVCVFATATPAFALDFGAQGNKMFNDVKNLIGGVLVVAGAAVGIYGGIRAGLAFRNHNSNDVSDGFMTVFGGLVIAGGGVLFSNLTL